VAIPQRKSKGLSYLIGRWVGPKWGKNQHRGNGIPTSIRETTRESIRKLSRGEGPLSVKQTGKGGGSKKERGRDVQARDIRGPCIEVKRIDLDFSLWFLMITWHYRSPY